MLLLRSSCRVSGVSDPYRAPSSNLRIRSRCSPEPLRTFFFSIDDVLLKRPGAETEIWQFESEWDSMGACWSPYFEWMWWFSCMWTVRTGPHDVVVIGASATD
jgi:hypothetical protein